MTEPRRKRALVPHSYLLSPFFLDQDSPGLQSLAGKDWHRNAVPIETSQGQVERMSRIHRGLRDLVCDAAARSERPVCIAGDCCSAIPVLGGLQRAGVDPVLVWLDAHGDFNTASTTISGFLGGMPLAMMTGRGEQDLMRASEVRPLPDADVVLSDARDLDPAERELLQASGVRRLGSVNAILGALPPDRPLHVHLDCDILDAGTAPAMRYPVPGGPALPDLVRLAASLHRSGRIRALSVTAWDLEADTDGTTARACMAVIDALTGVSAP